MLLPLLIPTAIILRFSGQGEVFFLQERIGKGGEVFKLFKFATMLKNSPNLGTGTVTIKEDPRVLPVGKYLRKAKINELPQLYNILLGEMSIIGPRPLTGQTFDAYPKHIQEIVQKVRPGLSGVGSIVFRDEENIMHGAFASVEFYKSIIAPYKGVLEEWFIIKKGLYIYFLTIFITVWIVFFPKSKIIWKVFKDLPEPPLELRQELNFPD